MIDSMNATGTPGFAISPQDFLNTVAGYAQQSAPQTSASKPIKLATVTSLGGGNTVRVQFDGESVSSTKYYPCLATYTAAVSNRVALMPTGTTYLVIGAVGAPGANLSVSGNLTVTGTATLNSTATVNGNAVINGSLTVSGVGQTQFVRKTADESVTSSTTLQNDNHLVLPVVANATYSLFLMCIFSGGTVGDIKFDWTVPTGTVLRWSDQTGTSGLHSNVDVYSAPGGTTQVAFQVWATVVTSGTAGNIQFRWAQNASDATATIVRANSHLCLDRVA
ncbi:hypothetical protein ACWDMY_01315 [Streptomyces globisporus]